MNDKLGTPIEVGSIITNLDSEYQVGIVLRVGAETINVLQYDNAEKYFYSNSWGNHVKVVSHINDELDMDAIRQSGSKLRREYIQTRRAELHEELETLDHMSRDIFYDGENVGFNNG